jgi:AcrR family transcriptional regulator
MASKIKDRILAHAVICFAAHGYHGVSTKFIAKRANVTEGSLFRLFLSKDNLFTETLSLALASKLHRRAHFRLAAFALLERKGLSEPNRKALRRLAMSEPLIMDLHNSLPSAIR